MRAASLVVGAIVGGLCIAFGSQFVFGRGPATAPAAEPVAIAVPGPMRADRGGASDEVAPVAPTPAPVAEKPGRTKSARLPGQNGAATGENPSATVWQGRFRDAEPTRKGTGQVELVKTERGWQARLTGFSVTPGTGLEIWLVAHADPKKPRDVTKSKYLSLGSLRSPKGDQVYTLPDDVDPAQFRSVVIWSKQFDAFFAAAPLKARA